MKNTEYRDTLNIFPEITPEKLSKLMRYVALIHEYNQKFNLVSRTDVNKLWENHIFPSLIALNLIEFPIGVDVLDFGSGAGLPGIPIKILRPDLGMFLVDSVRKKTLFQKRIQKDLELANLNIFNFRLGMDPNPLNPNQKFFIVMARAVTSIENLYTSTYNLLQKKGFLLLWKGIDDLRELEKIRSKFNFSSEVIVPTEHLYQYIPKTRTMRLIKISH